MRNTTVRGKKQAWIEELGKEGPANRGAFPFDPALQNGHRFGIFRRS